MKHKEYKELRGIPAITYTQPYLEQRVLLFGYVRKSVTSAIEAFLLRTCTVSVPSIVCFAVRVQNCVHHTCGIHRLVSCNVLRLAYSLYISCMQIHYMLATFRPNFIACFRVGYCSKFGCVNSS